MRLHLRVYHVVAFSLLASLAASAAANGRVIQKPGYDPNADRVGLLEGIDNAALAVRMVPRGAEEGSLFVENRSDRPLTVELPDSVVGVHVLPQQGDLFPEVGNDNSGPSQQGGNQPVGIGFPQQRGGSNGLNNVRVNVDPQGFPPGNGLFSIPAGRVARIPYRSVCLEQGKPEPKPGNDYRLVRTEEFSAAPHLPELLRLVGAGEGNQNALQAAAWHLEEGTSWERLQALQFNRLNAPDTPLLTRTEIREARQIVERITRDSASEQDAKLAQKDPRR